jgi:hypothetical protein
MFLTNGWGVWEEQTRFCSECVWQSALKIVFLD